MIQGYNLYLSLPFLSLLRRHYHGSVFTSLISLSSLRLSLACYRNFVPKKKIWESPTEPACSSNYRSSPPPQTTGPSISTTPFTKVRSNLLPPIRIPARGHRFLSLRRRRMLHQERRRLGQPPSLSGRQVPGVQLHLYGLGIIRRTLAQPPPPQRPGNLLLESPQHVSRHPQG